MYLPDIDVCMHMNAPNDEEVSAMCCIVRASGNLDKVDWFRAFDTGKQKAVIKSLGCNEYLYLCGGGRVRGKIMYI